MHEPTIDDEVLRPTRIDVDLDALAHNYAAIGQHCGVPVMAILKANAYGHGAIEVARRLEAAGAAMFGVAYLEEGLRLRHAGIKTPILVLGGIVGEQIPLFLNNDLQLCASSVDKLRAIEAAAESLGVRARVHLKIDTGMERIGVHWYSATALLEASQAVPHVEIAGIFSHFANADVADLTHAKLQYERFCEVLRWYEDRAIRPPMRHMSNSGAILTMPEARFDMVRPGILLYGVQPSPECPRSVSVRPALRWSSRVVYFKVVKADNPVSYGSTWAPTRDTRVITVPVGYGDGYLRAMSGRAQVVVRGTKYPVVGRICMDQIMVDIGQGSAFNGDEVVLIGDGVTVEDLADWAGTIPHEVLTSINTRVPRIHR